MLKDNCSQEASDARKLRVIFVSFSEHSSDGINILEENPDLLNKPLRDTGMTPIFMAIRTNDENEINWLLKKGVKLTLKDNKGRTVLDYLPDVSSEQIKNNIKMRYYTQMNMIKNQIANHSR